MNLIRLGDLLSEESAKALQPFTTGAGNLAIRIFDPDLKSEDVLEYYVNSPSRPARSEEPICDPIVSSLQDLGDFERKILAKIRTGRRRVYCIVGPLGCGKTTTIRYLIQRLQAIPCHQCAIDTCSKFRMIAYIDCNREQFTTTDEAVADEYLKSQLITDLLTALRIAEVPTEEEELIEFWNEELTQLRTAIPQSTAFKALLRRSGVRSVTDLREMPAAEAMGFRQALVSSLSEDNDEFLDYLVRLWGFVIRHHYQGNRDCAFVVVDNIDRASLVVQAILLNIVKTCAHDAGPLFIVLVRPETFSGQGMRGNNILDADHHVGPIPGAVVLERLARFIADPESRFEPRDDLTRAEFCALRDFLCEVHELIQNRGTRRSHFLRFLDKACGKSHRLALLSAQKLLSASSDDILELGKSTHKLVRLSVRLGQPQYKWTPRSPICNLFHVADAQHGRLLAKPRILKILKLSPPHYSRTLSDIRDTLMAFGYPPSTICTAVNELANIYCQLVRTDGFHEFTLERFLESGSMRIVLTDLGRGYQDVLLGELDYVGEVMLDSLVSPELYTPPYGFGYLFDRLHLLSRFLDEVRRTDRKETETYTDRYGRKEYFANFGDGLISLDTIWKLDRAVRRVIKSGHGETPSGQYKKLLEYYDGRLRLAAWDNHHVLGLWPGFVDYGDAGEAERLSLRWR